jgi:hypothetical protein
MSGRCKGLHCDGCPGGGAGVGVVIALLVIIAVGLRSAWPAIVHAIEIAAWTVAGIAGAAILVTGTALTVRVTRRVRARRARRQVAYHATILPPARPAGRPAIGRPARHRALGQPPQRPAGAWPLPGWWEGIRPRIGGDSDERRPR